MTTDEQPLNGGFQKDNSPGIIRDAIRQRREENLAGDTFRDLREELQETLLRIGSVSLTLTDFQRVAEVQIEQAKAGQEAIIGRVENLATSVQTSFDAMAMMLRDYPGRVEGQLSRLETEMARREGAMTLQLRWLAAAGLALCLVGGLVGWKMTTAKQENEILAMEMKTQQSLKEGEIFGLYLLGEQSKVAERYWKEMTAWRSGKKY